MCVCVCVCVCEFVVGQLNVLYCSMQICIYAYACVCMYVYVCVLVFTYVFSACMLVCMHIITCEMDLYQCVARKGRQRRYVCIHTFQWEQQAGIVGLVKPICQRNMFGIGVCLSSRCLNFKDAMQSSAPTSHILFLCWNLMARAKLCREKGKEETTRERRGRRESSSFDDSLCVRPFQVQYMGNGPEKLIRIVCARLCSSGKDTEKITFIKCAQKVLDFLFPHHVRQRRRELCTSWDPHAFVS